MKNEIEIMARIMQEDNRLHVRLTEIYDIGIDFDGLDNNLVEIIMDMMDVPDGWRDDGKEKYYNFFKESRSYAECEAFLIEWKMMLDEEKAGLGGRGPR